MRHFGSFARSLAVSSIAFSTSVDVGIRRHRQIDDHPRPALRQIADAEDLAVADVPERPVHIADVGHAHAHVLDDPRGESEVDDVADADLVLGDDEDAVEDVLHDVLRPEAETRADRGGSSVSEPSAVGASTKTIITQRDDRRWSR